MAERCEHIKESGEQCRAAAIWGSDPPRCSYHRLDGGPRAHPFTSGNQLGRLTLKHGYYRAGSSGRLAPEERVARHQLIQARLETLLDQADSERQVLHYSQLLRWNLGHLMALLEEYNHASGQHPDRLLEKAAGKPLAALQADIKAGLQAAREEVKRTYPTTRHRSPRYWLVYEAIVDHIRNHYVSPTWRQLRRSCGISSNRRLAHWLDQLEQDGMIIRRPGPRGLDLPGEPDDPDPQLPLPESG